MTAQTGLHFTASIDGLDDDTLLVTGFSGQEHLSQPFEFQLDLVGRNTCLSLWQAGEAIQRRHGIACDFRRADSGHRYTLYGLTLVPEILSVLLQEMGINDYAFALREDHHQAREYCVQYRETDLEFFHRLAARRAQPERLQETQHPRRPR